MERSPCQTLDDGTLVFSIGPELLAELRAWQGQVDRSIAEQQVRTGGFFDGSRLDKNVVQDIRGSLERGDPRPLEAGNRVLMPGSHCGSASEFREPKITWAEHDEVMALGRAFRDPPVADVAGVEQCTCAIASSPSASCE
jgi:hypothetical protein